MKTNENQRVRLTKRLLRESLISLLEQKELSKISVTELCENAGINRTTFYRYYGSQFDVLEEMGYEMAEKIRDLGKSHSKDGERTLKEQVTEICHYLQENRREAVLVLQNFSADSRVIQEIFRYRIIDQPQYLEFIQSCDETTRDLLNTFMLNGIYSLIRKWLIEDIEKTAEEIGCLAKQIAQEGWLKS